MKMKSLFKDNRGQVGNLSDLSTIAIGVVIFILVVAIGSTVLDEVQDTQVADSVAFNTTNAGLTGLALFGDFTSVIVLVGIAAVILGLISVAFRSFT